MSNKHPALKATPIVKNGRPVWTLHKLMAEMRQAGWQAMGQGVWQHPDCPGFQLQLFAFDAVTRRELWHRYAEANEAPRAEDFR